MSDALRPMPFEKMIHSLINEYKKHKTFYGVPVVNAQAVPVGPAAGPHTQLAANIICAYGAGATYFELKTVQVLEGKALNITKPCIYVGQEVYNTEWSTELTVKQAAEEYIKAYLLIAVLSRAFNLRPLEELHFIMSVGYDLAGIKSDKVNDFINTMKQAALSEEWQRDCQYIKANGRKRWGLTEDTINEILSYDSISDTVTLSTLHGCKKEEIKEIVLYLIKEKGLHTYVKLNPTLLGKESIRQILDCQGYREISFSEEMFAKDLNLIEVQEMIKKLQESAQLCNREFGIKLTNTFPVQIQHQELSGKEMYMSGPILYPIAIGVTYELARAFEGKIKISYSGGIDAHNIRGLLECGIEPVTVSSFLLKPGGYRNLSKLISAGAGYEKAEEVKVEKLGALAEAAEKSRDYAYKARPIFKKAKDYDAFCSRCNCCTEVCPNRANAAVWIEGRKYVVHLDDLCNECGCCSCECMMGHSPYAEKFTIFTDQESFEGSSSDGVLYSMQKDEKMTGENQILAYRQDGRLQAASPLAKAIISEIQKEGRI